MTHAVRGAFAALVIDEVTHMINLSAVANRRAEDAVRTDEVCDNEAARPA
jgi:hypothetical protein